MSKVILDEELKEELKDAKTKPRNFVIIAKGVKVVKLLVSKRPIPKGTASAAKTEFKGDDIIRGICAGDGGQDIVFQVLEETKIVPQKFKEFLTEQTGLTVKPQFQVVKQISEVNEEGSGSGPTSTSQPQTQVKQEVQEDPIITDLRERMKKLVPMIQEALKKTPERRPDFESPLAAFKTHAGENNVEGTKAALLAAGKLVQEILGPSRPPPQRPVSSGTPTQTQTPKDTSGPPPQTPPVSGGVPSPARQKKRDELEPKAKLYKKTIENYESKLTTNADPQLRRDYDKWALDLAAADKLANDDAAIQAYEALIASASSGTRTASGLVVRDQNKQKGAPALDALEQKNTVPEYGGKNPLKSTGKKEFERDVTRPVGALLAAIKGPVTQGLPIPETNHTELVRLKEVLAKKTKEYEAKAKEVDKDKHKHTHKLYDDYKTTCENLLTELKSVETSSTNVSLTAYRDKKREAEAALTQFDKTVELWKRLDPETHKLQLEVVASKRKAFQLVVDQHAKDNDSDKALTAMNGVIADVNKAIKAAFASQKGNDLLDGAVKKIGREAKSSADKEFVKEALKARFDLDRFEGDLTGTSLVALYKVFGSVPDSHTKNNKWLTDLKRKSELSDVESYYSAPEKDKTDKPKGTVVIKAMRSAGVLAAVQNNMMGPLLLKNVVGNKKVDQFSWVTLHEIGHAVDHADDFMKNRKKDFGDWQDHTPEQIEKLMLTEFAKEHPKLSKAFLKKYLVLAKKGDDPSKDGDLAALWKNQARIAASGVTEKELLADPGLAEAEKLRVRGNITDDESNGVKFKVKLTGPKRMVASEVLQGILTHKRPAADVIKELIEDAGEIKNPDEDPNWKALAGSKILAWYKNAVLKEPPGIFAAIRQMTGTANWIRAATVPIGGRVYHEAYEKDWKSYEPWIRDNRVSDYQLRAEGEYFAEAYAAFNMGKLPSTAPLYKDLEILKAKKELGKKT